MRPISSFWKSAAASRSSDIELIEWWFYRLTLLRVKDIVHPARPRNLRRPASRLQVVKYELARHCDGNLTWR